MVLYCINNKSGRHARGWMTGQAGKPVGGGRGGDPRIAVRMLGDCGGERIPLRLGQRSSAMCSGLPALLLPIWLSWTLGTRGSEPRR